MDLGQKAYVLAMQSRIGALKLTGFNAGLGGDGNDSGSGGVSSLLGYIVLAFSLNYAWYVG